ncbi:MAG: EamA family transporter [Hyphomicrobiales bacterium]|nr:EamA family transporter [Hyphomicrobiales bacterium]
MLVRLIPAAFVLLWSTGYIGSRLGAPYAEPFTFLAIRFVAVISILAVVAVFRGMAWPNGRAAAHSMVVGVLVHGGYLGGVFWAIDRGMPAGVAALIVGLQPIATALFAGRVLGETVTIRHWLGLGVGLAGIALVVAPKLEWTGTGITPTTVAVVIFAMLSITLGTIYQKRFAVAAPFVTGIVTQYLGALIVVGLAAALSENFEITWSGEFIFALSWLVLVLSIGAISLLMLMIREGAVSKVATLLYLVPAATAVIAYFLFGETLSAVQLLGMAVTVLAVALAAK